MKIMISNVTPRHKTSWFTDRTSPSLVAVDSSGLWSESYRSRSVLSSSALTLSDTVVLTTIGLWFKSGGLRYKMRGDVKYEHKSVAKDSFQRNNVLCDYRRTRKWRNSPLCSNSIIWFSSVILFWTPALTKAWSGTQKKVVYSELYLQIHFNKKVMQPPTSSAAFFQSSLLKTVIKTIACSDTQIVSPVHNPAQKWTKSLNGLYER